MDPLAQAVTSLLSGPPEPPRPQIQIQTVHVPIGEILDHYVSMSAKTSMGPGLKLAGYRWYINPKNEEILFELGIETETPKTDDCAVELISPRA